MDDFGRRSTVAGTIYKQMIVVPCVIIMLKLQSFAHRMHFHQRIAWSRLLRLLHLACMVPSAEDKLVTWWLLKTEGLQMDV